MRLLMDTSDAYRRIREDRKVKMPAKPETWAAAYVTLRRALGFGVSDTKHQLRSLLRVMRSRGLTSFNQIDHNLATEWLHSGSPQEKTVIKRLTPMRGFFQYLLSFGVVSENIWQATPIPKTKHFIPHIFAVEELSRLFNYLRAQIPLGRPSESKTRCAYFTMFHTIYACGLRPREACRLKTSDIDFKRSFLVVRNTKFYKSRIVPFNSRTRELVLEYLSQFRPADDELPPDAPLFINFHKHAFRRRDIGRHFHLVCKRLGIYRPKWIKGNTVFGGTTVHALRHSFAVHRLLKWYKEGADVNAKLPLLATYMGHVLYYHTQCYLTVLPIFTDIAGKMFADKFETPLKDLECLDNS